MLTELERDLQDLRELQAARALVAADDQREGAWPRELRFYHGTSRANAEAIRRDGFQLDLSCDSSCLGRGVYVGRPDKALRFARNKAWHGGDEGALLEVLVSIARPKFVDQDDLGWQAEGYDACRADHTSRSNHMEWCIADPAACKPTGRLLPVPIDEVPDHNLMEATVPDHNLVETAERVGPAQAPARAREAEEVQEERRTEEIATEIEEIEEVATEQMEISMEVNFPEPTSTLSFKLPSWREVEAERAAKKKPLDLFARARAASASTPPSTERPGGAAAGGAATPAMEEVTATGHGVVAGAVAGAPSLQLAPLVPERMQSDAASAVERLIKAAGAWQCDSVSCGAVGNAPWQQCKGCGKKKPVGAMASALKAAVAVLKQPLDLTAAWAVAVAGADSTQAAYAIGARVGCAAGMQDATDKVALPAAFRGCDVAQLLGGPHEEPRVVRRFVDVAGVTAHMPSLKRGRDDDAVDTARITRRSVEPPPLSTLSALSRTSTTPTRREPQVMPPPPPRPFHRPLHRPRRPGDWDCGHCGKLVLEDGGKRTKVARSHCSRTLTPTLTLATGPTPDQRWHASAASGRGQAMSTRRGEGSGCGCRGCKSGARASGRRRSRRSAAGAAGARARRPPGPPRSIRCTRPVTC